MGTNRSAGRTGFIDSVMDAVMSSYELIGQRLQDWSAAPPRLRQPDEVEVDEKNEPMAIRSNSPDTDLA